jgi:hypothetical protein
MAALLVVVTYLTVEIIAFFANSLLQRSPYSYRGMAAQLSNSASVENSSGGHEGTTEIRWGNYVEVIHPYFGFVADPEKNRASWAVSDFGFVFDGKSTPITRRSQNRLVVAVFGGSFSSGEYSLLKAAFEAHAAELHRELVFVNFSAAGYKQPQHLLVLNYFMALGAQFDIVVNIDGFNEVTLPVAENIPGHVNPFFPRGWDRRAAATISQSTIRQIGKVEYLKSAKAAWASLFLKNRLYVSPTLGLIWRLRDSALSRELYVTEREMAGGTQPGVSYSTHGPTYTSDSDDQLFSDLAAMWKNSSLQMNALCEASGAEYYHFLQPNQYVPDSKPMTAEERSKVITPMHPYARGVLKGYPYLRKAGEELKKSRVHFYDLTGIFENESRMVYDDDCCHLNATGYRIVADRIYSEINKIHGYPN